MKQNILPFNVSIVGIGQLEGSKLDMIIQSLSAGIKSKLEELETTIKNVSE